jgi:glycosyltransferase involved in cell wall biosynthesis
MTQTAAPPRFSVVMPSFNTAQYLRETLESIVSQDYPDLEIIITDGRSTDGTLDILREYGDRIRWISEPDEGQCDAINKGFRMATGTLHDCCNADDQVPLRGHSTAKTAAGCTNGRFVKQRCGIPMKPNGSYGPVV